jgi:hypothetical protein
MSVEQLAIDTKIPRASIEALEEDRFSALPGPVFVKGFFRCCARSLGVDAEVVLALLHEHERALQQIKSGGRRERPHLLGRAAASARPAPAASAPVQAVAGEPTLHVPAAGGAASAATAGAPSIFNFDALLSTLARVAAGASNSRLLMWIAIGLMIAVIVVTAFVMAGGGPPGLPQS